MSVGAGPLPHDFRKPRQLADDVDRELSTWLRSFANLISDRWEIQLGVRLNWELSPLTNITRRQVSERLSADFVCYGLRFEQAGDIIWLAFPRPLVLAIMAAMLGEELSELPTDRQLSDVELSLMELAMSELARAMTDSQPVAPPLVCEFVGPRRTQELTREFNEQDPIAVADFEVLTPAGKSTCLWIMPQRTVLTMMTHIGEQRQQDVGSANDLQSLVRQIPMQLIVRLGSANLHVSDLLNLQPGDVVVLDQRVNEPLDAEVSDTPIFRGWPGRVGTKQAFQVSDVIAERQKKSA